jgi:photosystem II stability/assembly factor-like uncharacterized protein
MKTVFFLKIKEKMERTLLLIILLLFIITRYVVMGGWANIVVSPKDYSYRAASWSSVSNVVMVGGSAVGGSIIYSSNQGYDFNQASISSYSLWDISSATINGTTYFLTVDDLGQIFGSSDLGLTWSLYFSSSASLYSVCIGTNGKSFAVGKNLKLYSATSNNYRSWTTLTSPATGSGSYYGVSTVDGVNLIMVGTKGVHYSLNSATSWSQPTSFTANTLYSLSHGNASTAITAGDFFTIAITFNYGATWKKLTVPGGVNSFSCKFHTVSMLSPLTAFVAASANSGAFSVIYKTVDGGNTWLQQVQVSAILYSVTMFNSRYGVAGAVTQAGVYIVVPGFIFIIISFLLFIFIKSCTSSQR